MAKDFGNLKPWQENPNDVARLDSSTGGQIGAAQDSISYADSNSTQSNMTDNPADSRARNRTNIQNLKPADASDNAPQSFSGDPIIEANIRTNAQKQAVIKKVMQSSQQSGPKNKSMGEEKLVEWDQED